MQRPKGIWPRRSIGQWRHVDPYLRVRDLRVRGLRVKDLKVKDLRVRGLRVRVLTVRGLRDQVKTPPGDYCSGVGQHWLWGRTRARWRPYDIPRPDWNEKLRRVWSYFRGPCGRHRSRGAVCPESESFMPQWYSACPPCASPLETPCPASGNSSCECKGPNSLNIHLFFNIAKHQSAQNLRDTEFVDFGSQTSFCWPWPPLIWSQCFKVREHSITLLRQPIREQRKKETIAVRQRARRRLFTTRRLRR